ncbi:glycosyltransferase [Mesorhizobium sp. M0047]|uniref:glycosyltransferase n=1 Tax=Mesorhizobium sp. M0047 TaxID=2956859 RepID=UPI00333AB76C
MNSRLEYNIDALEFSNGRWRLWGWVFAPDAEIRNIELRVMFGSVLFVRPLTVGGHRPDVAGSFAESRNAMYSGFFGFGTAPAGGQAPSTVELAINFKNALEIVIDVSRFAKLNQSSMSRLLEKAKVAGRLARSGQYHTLVHKLTAAWNDHRRRIPPASRDDALHVAMAEPGLVLLFDHSMGGGANAFSSGLERGLLEAGKTVARVRYSINDLMFHLEVFRNKGLVAARSLRSTDDLAALLQIAQLEEVHVNSTVSFPSNADVVSMLLSALQLSKQSIFYFHDFYSVCPSFNLLDQDRKFCGVPGPSHCNAVCIPNNRDPFMLSQAPQKIEEWRSQWKPLFESVGSIRFFSQSSLQLFRKAFPDIANDKCYVEPHAAPDSRLFDKSSFAPSPSLGIAVVGTINYAKGADVVAELCRYIARERLDMSLVIIGTIDRELDYPFVTITGPYVPSALPRLMQRHGVAVALFASVWPETYSFVVAELQAMGVPIVAFDLGAPAERLQGEASAKLLPLGAGPADLVAALQAAAVVERPQTIPAAVKQRNRVCAFTSAATNYLPKAMLLGQSLKTHHPEIDVYYGLSDRRSPDVDYRRGVFDDVISAEDLNIQAFSSWSFRHTLVELSTAIKPFVAAELFRRGYEEVYYFDPDIVLFSRLDDLMAHTAAHSVTLTPHQTAPDSDFQAIIDNEIASLKHGVYNLGYVGIRNTDAGRRFTDWWAKRVYRWCRDDIPNGLFTDQRWIDLAPALFPDVFVMRESRFNVSTWNLTQRHFAGSISDGYIVDGQPLGFYHFTGFDKGAHRVMAEKNSRANPAVMGLVDWYQEKIKFAPDDPASGIGWAYGRYANTAPIPLSHRIIYRDREDLQLAFPDPFETPDEGGFLRWVRSQGRIEYPDLDL